MMAGLKSKVLSGLFNLGCNETYTLYREWDGSASASRLFVGYVSHSAQMKHTYAKAHAMNYRIMMEMDKGCADRGRVSVDRSRYRKFSMKKLHVSHKVCREPTA